MTEQLKGTATADQVQSAIAWLRRQLEFQLRVGPDTFREAELTGLLELLTMHEGVMATDAMEQRVWSCRAKCTHESWRVYTDGELVVEAPCATIRALARPYAELADFPEVLRVRAS